LEDEGVNETKILIKMDLQDLGFLGATDSIDLSQDSDRWRAVVNAVTNLRVL
jgi:hypothetical protein